MRRRRVGHVLATAVAFRWAGARPLHAQDSDPVLVARAYAAAWSAHDLAAALALFAPDAEITYLGAGAPSPAEDAGHGEDTGGVVRVTGAAAIRAHLRAQFGWSGRVEAWNYRAADGVVTWSYRQRDALEPHLPGVAPVEGTAAASVRAGRITRLRLAAAPASVAARATAVAALVLGRVTHSGAAGTRGRAPGPAGTAPGPGAGTGAQPAPAPPDLAWPLGLVGLGAGAALWAGRRRRRAHHG